MIDLIKKILKEEISNKIISRVLPQLESGKIKEPYFKHLHQIGLTDKMIKVVLEQFTNGEVNKNLEWIKDSRDNIIYHENSDGDWFKKEYDDRGNNIYYEDSDGFSYRSEYDKDGNEIYIENSDGYWVKKEYDERGKLIYREDSNGDIIDKRK